ncbi:hypothetical protein CEXT_709151 [Caerostris extrusa]|uniref:Uncharacterized protein n=1 Tax=Caerostris extrusa TaxID=172846 RepID=A0AAV4VY58_CAEEX|nr:hypothetical protein CEXT_709151 [Caerostris extrusa]
MGKKSTRGPSRGQGRGTLKPTIRENWYTSFSHMRTASPNENGNSEVRFCTRVWGGPGGGGEEHLISFLFLSFLDDRMYMVLRYKRFLVIGRILWNSADAVDAFEWIIMATKKKKKKKNLDGEESESELLGFMYCGPVVQIYV